VVQRWSRGAELVLRCRCVCRSSAEVVHRCCRAGRGQVQMCKIDAKVGAGVQVQRCRGAEEVVQRWCRDGSEVVFLPTTTQILEGIGEVCKNHVLAVPP
jgi:hypothetical protein